MANMSKANVKQLGWAAVGVAAGLILFNNLRSLAGNTAIGKLFDGRLIRSA